MRQAPAAPTPDQVKKRTDTSVINQIRQYELITPLFGGGVEPGYADPVTVIRGTEIRGHLRFWWRAMCGGKYGGNYQGMKTAEDKLWGTASSKDNPAPSLVQIAVEVHEKRQLEDKSPFTVVHQYKEGKPQYKDGEPKPTVREHEEVAPAYVAFPLRPEGNLTVGMDTKTVLSGVKFALTISFPANTEKRKYKDEIEATLWAWETFGGIGARTRRGFGSIRLSSIKQLGIAGGVLESETVALPRAVEVEDQIRSKLPKAEENNWAPRVPHLSDAALLAVTKARTAASIEQAVLDVWKVLIDELKNFRQARNGTRGRSRWPEPEKIRKLTRQRLNKKDRNGKIKSHQPLPLQLDEFPRAAFGLPIVFHFKDSNGKNWDESKADPRDTSLQLAAHDRLASPLILRSIACADNSAVGIAVLLSDSNNVIELLDQNGMVLKTMKGTSNEWAALRAGLDDIKASKIVTSDGSKLLGDKTDVLSAFLNRLKKENG